jgi:hypothetical protein
MQIALLWNRGALQYSEDDYVSFMINSHNEDSLYIELGIVERYRIHWRLVNHFKGLKIEGKYYG